MNRRNLNESVYQYILEQILSMKYKPGDKIPEVKIAEEFGTSRTPIREALRRLADDGIVRMHPKCITEVAQWDDETMRQIGLMRIYLDVLAVKLAIHHGSNADFDQMFEHSKLCLAAANVGDVAKRIREDCTFHCDLSRISKNIQLYEFSRNIYLKIEFMQSWRGTFLEEPMEQHRQHEDIYKALLGRDATLATDLIVKHHIHFHNLEQYYPVDWIFAIGKND
ncbi:MAG TPA: GntR family transcriptional regulator [Candidatus Pullichristensenella stercorigallinarum]|uniref:GntR family transcriptional regulator n=1 Tax=Candidatus Pullichristensenella stercorigallinarum TaxID=2840909 RepID=A0A9D0ZLY7_9FIRM|nr:GntR family transcriptional regulator [Candidatus Pullichristensenella stercorigallinarum]